MNSSLKGLNQIKVTFFQPLQLLEQVTMVQQVDGTNILLNIQSQSKLLISIFITPHEKIFSEISSTPTNNIPKIAKEPAPSEVRGLKGSMDVWANENILQEKFPFLVKSIGTLRIASLLALSRLVGMICPGLNSIFSGLEISFVDLKSPHIDFEVIRCLIPKLRLSIHGGGIEGKVEAFFRPAPVKQIDLNSLRKDIKPKEFSQQTALIIGGSRGIGESVAKIIAVGGGQVIITYNQGEKDARKISEEINHFGGKGHLLQLDVNNFGTKIDDLMKSGLSPSHIYYFASPVIHKNKNPEVDNKLRENFRSFYVLAFEKMCKIWAKGSKVRIFYPSTIYLDQSTPGFVEYLQAKLEGEALCGILAHQYPNLSFLIERLPRMHTDQTNSFLEEKAVDPHEVMIGIVRKMNF